MTTTTATTATVETEEHTLTLKASGLPRVPNLFGGYAQVTRIALTFHAAQGAELRPTGIEFLDTAGDDAFLAPTSWEQPDGWPEWLREFADRLNPGHSGPAPETPVTIEHHSAKVLLDVVGFPPITASDGQVFPVAKAALSYFNGKPTAIRCVLANGDDLFVAPADLEQPQTWPRVMQRLVHEYHPFRHAA